MTELDRLMLIRHGQSVGNVADDRARAARAHRLDLDHRDADTPLSDTGREQAAALYWEAFGGKLGAVFGPDARAIAFISDAVVWNLYRGQR